MFTMIEGFAHAPTLVPFFVTNDKLWSDARKLRVTTATVFQSRSIFFQHKGLAVMPDRGVYTRIVTQ